MRDTKRIAELNDLARTAMGAASTLIQTRGVNALPPEVQSRIREKVEKFNTFTESNDPWGEHDFGSFYEGRINVYWKIDYQGKDGYLAEHPEDPRQTIRILTILLAEEY